MNKNLLSSIVLASVIGLSTSAFAATHTMEKTTTKTTTTTPNVSAKTTTTTKTMSKTTEKHNKNAKPAVVVTKNKVMEKTKTVEHKK